MKLLCLAMAMVVLMGAAGSIASADGDAAQAARIEAMRPAMDSALLAMLEREDGKYAPDDPQFVWHVLYLMGENFPASHPDVTMGEDGAVFVPEAAQLAFLRAAFAGLEALPAMPDSMRDMERFDEATRTYELAGSDRGDVDSALGDAAVDPDGSVRVPLNLTDWEETVIASAVFTLVPNEGAQPYAYRIQSAE